MHVFLGTQSRLIAWPERLFNSPASSLVWGRTYILKPKKWGLLSSPVSTRMAGWLDGSQPAILVETERTYPFFLQICLKQANSFIFSLYPTSCNFHPLFGFHFTRWPCNLSHVMKWKRKILRATEFVIVVKDDIMFSCCFLYNKKQKVKQSKHAMILLQAISRHND